jgi:hypothetical protein
MTKVLCVVRGYNNNLHYLIQDSTLAISNYRSHHFAYDRERYHGMDGTGSSGSLK